MRDELPPYDQDAEEAVLGSILIDSDAFNVVSDIVNPEDFFSDQNQYVFIAISNIAVGINQITVAQELIRMGKLDDAGGAAYLSHLVAIVPTSLHAEYYAKIVKKLSVSRRIISLAGQIENIGYKTYDPDIAFDKIQELVTQQQSYLPIDALISPVQLFNMGIDLYTKRKEGLVKYCTTGIDMLDREIGGLFESELTILAARPGVGKTQLAIQIAKYVGANATEPVLFGSLEMHWKDILDRMVATEMEVHPRSLRFGHYYDDFYQNIIDSMPKVTGGNIHLFGKGMLSNNLSITTDSLYRAAYTLKKTKGLSLLVIDHMGCFGDNFGHSSYERVSYIAQRLKNINNALEVPILCLCQLSRAVESQKNHRPSLKDLRDSGKTEEIADNVLFLYRPDKYPEEMEEHPELRGMAELILAKQRQGESDSTIPLRWDENKRIYE
jgi:replicative DNA helicase